MLNYDGLLFQIMTLMEVSSGGCNVCILQKMTEIFGERNITSQLYASFCGCWRIYLIKQYSGLTLNSLRFRKSIIIWLHCITVGNDGLIIKGVDCIIVWLNSVTCHMNNVFRNLLCVWSHFSMFLRFFCNNGPEKKIVTYHVYDENCSKQPQSSSVTFILLLWKK